MITLPRKFTLRTLLLAMAVCATAFALYRWLPNPVTDEELERVNAGMTKSEVRELLGEPDAMDGNIWRYGVTGLVYFGKDGLADFTERM